MKEYIIYDHTSPSGKHYIGQTCLKANHRWGNNGKNYLKLNKDGNYIQPLFARAILKYGWDNFKHTILFKDLSKLDADLIEEDLIWYYKKQGISYNITDGGEGTKGHKKSKEFLEKQSQRMKGQHMSPSTEFKKGHKNSPEAEKKRIAKRSKPIIQLTLDGEFVKEWPSARSVEEFGMSSSSITRAANGVYKQAYGYKWVKKDDYEGHNS